MNSRVFEIQRMFTSLTLFL
uniref:Uncharacterized protein n=1 Tax=Anguilla anguilla TaxID=7936 RepID=A0A0E9THK6_ANGAN